MLFETHARIYNKRMLIAQDCVKFRGRRACVYCLTEISCKQLCRFPGCAGKNNLDFILSLVAFGVSNICYSLVIVLDLGILRYLISKQSPLISRNALKNMAGSCYYLPNDSCLSNSNTLSLVQELCFSQGYLKEESVVRFILPSCLEVSYCTSGFFFCS